MKSDKAGRGPLEKDATYPEWFKNRMTNFYGKPGEITITIDPREFAAAVAEVLKVNPRYNYDPSLESNENLPPRPFLRTRLSPFIQTTGYFDRMIKLESNRRYWHVFTGVHTSPGVFIRLFRGLFIPFNFIFERGKYLFVHTVHTSLLIKEEIIYKINRYILILKDLRETYEHPIFLRNLLKSHRKNVHTYGASRYAQTPLAEKVVMKFEILQTAIQNSTMKLDVSFLENRSNLVFMMKHARDFAEAMFQLLREIEKEHNKEDIKND